MKSKEIYLLIHAAWLGSWQWQNVTTILEKNGHTVITPDLPGHGADKTPSEKITMESYVDSITSILDQQNQPVILVGHSFNGITVSRVSELRPQKIKKLVYLAGFLLPKGGSFIKAVELIKASKAVQNFYLSDDQLYALVKEDEIQNAFAHDIPKEIFDMAKPFIVPEPISPLMYPLEISAEKFETISKYYIECTEDQALPIEAQKAMYRERVNKKNIYTLNSSHTPNFSQPEELASILSIISEV
ncbi:MAG: alpha/beta fold hydrolase [Flavobacteriales bacterium]|jgi:pimeloyl-ACP methyl ester carboxylesterase|nr:alpha/beta fold hydrolase [Flavobacteriales bacterium]